MEERETDTEVCTCVIKAARLYLCDGSEAAQEIQTPNIADKNAG